MSSVLLKICRSASPMRLCGKLSPSNPPNSEYVLNSLWLCCTKKGTRLNRVKMIARKSDPFGQEPVIKKIASSRLPRRQTGTRPALPGRRRRIQKRGRKGLSDPFSDSRNGNAICARCLHLSNRDVVYQTPSHRIGLPTEIAKSHFSDSFSEDVSSDAIVFVKNG